MHLSLGSSEEMQRMHRRLGTSEDKAGVWRWEWGGCHIRRGCSHLRLRRAAVRRSRAAAEAAGRRPSQGESQRHLQSAEQDRPP